MTMQTFGDIGITVAFIVFAGHMFLYAVTAPWWRSLTGRSVMALVAVLAMVLALSVSTLWFGVQWPARLLLRALVFWAIAAAGAFLGVAHVRQKLGPWRAARRAGREECDETRI
jgi:hypothetical protein